MAVLEHAYYSVISPEGCAGILWKSHSYAERAASALRFTSADLLEFGVIDEIIPEPLGGAHRDHHQTAANVKRFLLQSLRELTSTNADDLLRRRYEKFRAMGQFLESDSPPSPPAADRRGEILPGNGNGSDQEDTAAENSPEAAIDDAL